MNSQQEFDMKIWGKILSVMRAHESEFFNADSDLYCDINCELEDRLLDILSAVRENVILQLKEGFQ